MIKYISEDVLFTLLKNKAAVVNVHKSTGLFLYEKIPGNEPGINLALSLKPI